MSRKVVFTIHFAEWKSHIKKEVNYKQRCEQKRALFTEDIKGISPENLVYIDETGVDNNLSKLRGWALKGFKSFTEALGFRTKRITLIGGYCYGTKELVAPMEYDGYTNSDIFLSWVELALCKELKPNQVVIMDNASFHKSAKVKELIELVGCRLIYLPPYSPDLNPIEHVWANLKRCIRVNDNRQNNLSLAIEQPIAQLFMC
jgi:transposase